MSQICKQRQTHTAREAREAALQCTNAPNKQANSNSKTSKRPGRQEDPTQNTNTKQRTPTQTPTQISPRLSEALAMAYWNELSIPELYLAEILVIFTLEPELQFPVQEL